MKTMKLYPCFQHWLHGGQIYIYSDPHFGDEYNHELRPNNVDDETQVALINKKVTPNDTIIFLGDICDKEFIKKIRGYKVLITGNHDVGATTYQRKKYDIKVPTEKYEIMPPNKAELKAMRLFPKDEDKQITFVEDLENKAREKALETLKAEENPDFVGLDHYISFDPSCPPYTAWMAHYDNQLFDEVYNGPVLISNKIILSHEPILGLQFFYNIHGHDHGQRVKDDMHFNCCAELINYTPICLKDIISSGILHNLPDIHRTTIDIASTRGKKEE